MFACSSYEIQRDPVFEETKIRNARPKLDREIFDEKEFEAIYRQSFVDADLIAERKVANVKRDENFILEFWQQKKKILELYPKPDVTNTLDKINGIVWTKSQRNSGEWRQWPVVVEDVIM